MAALAGVDLDRRRPRRANSIGVGGCFLIAFDHGNRVFVADPLQRFHQQRGLARTGARDQVEREGFRGLQIVPVLRRDGIIFFENIPLDAYQPRHTGAGRGIERMIMRMLVGVGMPMRVAVRMRVSVAIRMCVAVLVRVVVFMLVAMGAVGMLMRVVVRNILDPLLALVATAGAAHHTTSISLSSISSPL